MASVRGLTPEAIQALIEDATRDYRTVRENLTTMNRRYEGLDQDIEALNQRMEELPGDLGDVIDLDEVLEAARDEVADLRRRFPIKAVDIADGAVTADKVQAGSIVAVHLAANAVTSEKIAANAITANKIAAEAVTAGKLSANSVTANTIASEAIVTRHIGSAQVTAEKIKAGAVTAEAIAAGSITADNIEAGVFRVRPNSVLPPGGLLGDSKTEVEYVSPAPGVDSKQVGSYTTVSLRGLPTSLRLDVGDSLRFVELDTRSKYTIEYVVGIPNFKGATDEEVRLEGMLHTLWIDLPESAVGSTAVITEEHACRATVNSRDNYSVQINVAPMIRMASSGGTVPLVNDAMRISFTFRLSTPTESVKFTPTGISFERRGVKLPLFISELDMLYHPPTVQDVEDAQRQTELFVAATDELLRKNSEAISDIQETLRADRGSGAFVLVPELRTRKNLVELYQYGNSSLSLNNAEDEPLIYVYSHESRFGYLPPFSSVDLPIPRGQGPGWIVAELLADAILRAEYYSETVGSYLHRETEAQRVGFVMPFPYGDKSVIDLYGATLYASFTVYVTRVGSGAWPGTVTVTLRLDYHDIWGDPKTIDLDSQSLTAGAFNTHREFAVFNVGYEGEMDVYHMNPRHPWGPPRLVIDVYRNNTQSVIEGTTVRGGYITR